MEKIRPTVAFVMSRNLQRDEQNHAKAFTHLVKHDLGYDVIEVNTHRDTYNRDGENVDPMRELATRAANNALAMIVTTNKGYGYFPQRFEREIAYIRDMNTQPVPVLAFRTEQPDGIVDIGNTMYGANATDPEAFVYAKSLREQTTQIMTVAQVAEDTTYKNDLKQIRTMTEEERKSLDRELISTSNTLKTRENLVFGHAIDIPTLATNWASGYRKHYDAFTELGPILDIVDEAHVKRGEAELVQERNILFGLLIKVPSLVTPILQLFLQPELNPKETEEAARRAGEYLIQERRCIPVDMKMQLVAA